MGYTVVWKTVMKVSTNETNDPLKDLVYYNLIGDFQYAHLSKVVDVCTKSCVKKICFTMPLIFCERFYLKSANFILKNKFYRIVFFSCWFMIWFLHCNILCVFCLTETFLPKPLRNMIKQLQIFLR